jgi:hypothetical protein
MATTNCGNTHVPLSSTRTTTNVANALRLLGIDPTALAELIADPFDINYLTPGDCEDLVDCIFTNMQPDQVTGVVADAVVRGGARLQTDAFGVPLGLLLPQPA